MFKGKSKKDALTEAEIAQVDAGAAMAVVELLVDMMVTSETASYGQLAGLISVRANEVRREGNLIKEMRDRLVKYRMADVLQGVARHFMAREQAIKNGNEQKQVSDELSDKNRSSFIRRFFAAGAARWKGH